MNAREDHKNEAFQLGLGELDWTIGGVQEICPTGTKHERGRFEFTRVKSPIQKKMPQSDM